MPRGNLFVCLLLLGVTQTSFAQSSWTRADWNCASTSVYTRESLSRVVPRALKHAPETTKPPDRAFAFDLNNDKAPEFFVPFECGATGNCVWAIFTLAPSRFLGFLNGEYVYLRKEKNRWPDIYAYGHLSAVEGTLLRFRYRSGQYVKTTNSTAIGDVNHDPEIQSGESHLLPKRFELASKLCAEVGN